MADGAMKDLLVSIFGAPEGVVLFQLIHATQFTIYLSLVAFLGGGLIGAGVAFCRIVPSRSTIIDPSLPTIPMELSLRPGAQLSSMAPIPSSNENRACTCSSA